MTNTAAKKALHDVLNVGHPGSIYSSNQAGVAEGIAALKSAVTVTQIRARNAEFDCPHCGAEVIGWLNDPRGREDTCDECKQPYFIADDASVSIS